MEDKSSFSGAKIPAIAQELLPDEKIVWWAQPSAMRAVMKTIPAFLFGIPWTGSVGAVFYSLAQSNQLNKLNPAAWVFIIGLLPFVAIGLFMLVRPFYTYRIVSSSYYVATNRRLLAIRGGIKGRTVQSAEYKDLSNAACTEYGDRGDLHWSLPLKPNVNLGSSSSAPDTISFVGVQNPQKIEQIIQEQIGKLALY